jgi:short-subunit dehydrogenase
MKVILFGGSKGVGRAIKQQLEIGLHTVHEISRTAGTWSIEPPEGEFDVFIYCAGVGYFGNFRDVLNEQIQDMIMLNFVIPIAVGSTTVAKHYIFIASNSAYSGFEGSEVYCATKHGVLGFARALRKSGKKVSVISPGAIDTDFWKDSGRPLPELHMQPEDVADAVMACIENKACIEELLIMPQRGTP